MYVENSCIIHDGCTRVQECNQLNVCERHESIFVYMCVFICLCVCYDSCTFIHMFISVYQYLECAGALFCSVSHKLLFLAKNRTSDWTHTLLF